MRISVLLCTVLYYISMVQTDPLPKKDISHLFLSIILVFSITLAGSVDSNKERQAEATLIYLASGWLCFLASSQQDVTAFQITSFPGRF